MPPEYALTKTVFNNTYYLQLTPSKEFIWNGLIDNAYRFKDLKDLQPIKTSLEKSEKTPLGHEVIS